MKILRSNRRNAGLTLMEALVSIWVLAVLIAVLWPALAPRRHYGHMINCMNNLKQVGLSFRIWEGDNNDKYPMQLSVTNGGTMELVATGNVAATFQVMSNELSTPKILYCLQDAGRTYATNFTTDFNNHGISYFVAAEGDEQYPQRFLAGDANFELGGKPVQSGLQTLSTNRMFWWSKARHKRCGYIAFADGSVQEVSNTNLVTYVGRTGLSTNRLAIP